MALSAAEIRETFLRFFEARSHRRLASSSLVPDADPSLLFVNAGMVQFKSVFLGEEKRGYARAATSQKCMRVSGKHNDLENVGRTPRHHTFFEMLGNFSFGDYFKEEAIAWAWELVTEGFGIAPERLVASVFREDDEAFGIWRDQIGLPESRIYRLDEAENFWSMGDTGPCGPCSEIHVDFGPAPGQENDDPSSDSGRFLEIWNLVFMQFNRDASGAMTPLPAPSIDTGAGLERLAAVIQGVSSNYDIDLFRGILERAQELSGVTRGADPEKDVSLHVVADHARALTFLIGDGVLPANEGRGYVLRRILRRAARHGVLLGLERPFLFQVADAVIDEMTGAFPELSERRAYITDRIQREEMRFLETLSKGLTILESEVEKLRDSGQQVLPGESVFRLYDTYGFPVDLTQDILEGDGLGVDLEGFDGAMRAQRERARAAWKGSGDVRIDEVYGRLASDLQTQFHGYERLALASPIRAIVVGGELREAATQGEEVALVVDETPFYPEGGGQVGDRGDIRVVGGRVEVDVAKRPVGELIVHHGRVVEGEIRVETPAELAVDVPARNATVRNHTGTHLLHAALRRVLGPQAMQKGSLVAPDRLRFDFTHDAPLSEEEITKIERFANEWIEENTPARIRYMSYPEAIESGAIAIFEEKYGSEVRVISFGEASTELCGGTHVGATGEIGLFKILSDSSIAAGVRRIEALTGLGALEYLREQERTLRHAAELLKSAPGELPERVEKLLEEKNAAQRELEALRAAQRGAASRDLSEAARDVGGVRVVAAQVDGVRGKELRTMVDELRDKLGSGVVLLASEDQGRIALAVGVSKDLAKRFPAGDLVREVAAVVGGKGGGRPDFAQGGGTELDQLEAAFERLDQLLAGD